MQDDVVKKGSVRWKAMQAEEKRKLEKNLAHSKIKSFIDDAEDYEENNSIKEKKEKEIPEPDMSIVDDNKSPAPKLPIYTFGDWADWITIAAKSKSAPRDYVALSLLSATSSLISNVRQGSPWKDWVEPTILWCALVGSPSSNKSPALDIIRVPMRSLETKSSEEYKEKLKEYEVKETTAFIYKEQWISECEKAIKNSDLPPDKPAAAEKPDLPPRTRLTISDITIEKAAVVMMENPRGLLLCRDELAGLLANLERHGGSDREFYLESYGGRSYTVDRKKSPEPYIIQRLSIAILGTIQPDKLSRLLTETEDDGFAARFLYTEPLPVKFREPSQTMDKTQLLDAFKKLYELPLDEDHLPKIIPFSEQAKELFVEWRESLSEKEKDVQGVIQSFIGKMPGIIIRISVVLSYLNWVISGRSNEPTEIKVQYVKNAIELVDDYFIPMAKRTLGEYALPKHQSDARLIAKWILREKRKSINLRDMKREKDRVLPTSDPERYAIAIEFLEKCGWLIKSDERDGKKGRFQKTYTVNPLVYKS